MSYWDNITKIYEKQKSKGVDTYGQTLEENTTLNIEERLTMLEEELVDALMYIEHLKEAKEIKGCPVCRVIKALKNIGKG